MNWRNYRNFAEGDLAATALLDAGDQALMHLKDALENIKLAIDEAESELEGEDSDDD